MMASTFVRVKVYYPKTINNIIIKFINNMNYNEKIILQGYF